jgi:hypothetical protein
MTELEEAELTDGQGRALSARKGAQQVERRGRVAIIVGARLREALGAVAALRQDPLPEGDLAERLRDFFA